MKAIPHPGVAEISIKFKQYNSDLFEVWEDYLLLDFYLPHLHNNLKVGTVPDLPFDSLFSTNQTPFTKRFVYGVMDRIKKKQVPIRAFLEAVALTENYLQIMTYRLYRDHPYKLETKEETDDQQAKILRTIIESADRAEIIERLAEEKIRNIFYGRPVDFFKSDKAKVGVGSYLKSTYDLALDKFEEVIARRNVYMHNHGKVDRKYIREVKGTTFKLGERPIITKDYLKDSIKLLLGLCAVTTELALKNNYGALDISQKFKLAIKIFDQDYKGK
jgi:hypothetical protein